MRTGEELFWLVATSGNTPNAVRTMTTPQLVTIHEWLDARTNGDDYPGLVFAEVEREIARRWLAEQAAAAERIA